MSPPPDIDALSPAELKSLVFKLFEEQAELFGERLGRCVTRSGG